MRCLTLGFCETWPALWIKTIRECPAGLQRIILEPDPTGGWISALLELLVAKGAVRETRWSPVN